MSRPEWDEYFMNMARCVATRSTCLRRKVGAVLVKDNHIIATGYNGAPPRMTHCATMPNGCVRQELDVPSGERHELCRGVHAEMNAIAQAARHGTMAHDATLYSTTQPCVQCLKVLLSVGVRRILYEEGYLDPLAEEMVNASGILAQQYLSDEDFS